MTAALPPSPGGAGGSPRATRRDLLWIAALATIARAIYVVQFAATPLARHLLVDEAGYDRWAKAIAAGKILQDAPFYQAPLYPYLLGACYRLFGDGWLLVRIAQAAGGVATALLLYLVALRAFGRGAARFTGLLAALYVPFIFHEGLLVKEPAAILLTGLLLLLLLRADERGRGHLLAGVVLGLLSLLRENALLYLPALLVWLLWPRRAEDSAAPAEAPSLPRRAATAASLVAGMALALLPALAHNLAAGGGLLLTTSQAGSNYYIGNHPGALGVYEPIRRGREDPEFEGRDALEEASRRAGRSLAPSEVSRFWFGEAWRFAREQPLEFASLQARKLLLTFHAREIPDVWDIDYVATLVPVLRWPLPRFGWIAPLALLGIALARPLRRGPALLALLAAATAFSIAAFYVFARYRLPLAVFVLLFAGHALAWIVGAAGLRRGIRAPRRPGVAPDPPGEEGAPPRRPRALLLAAAALVPLTLLVHLPLRLLGLAFTDEVAHQNLAMFHLDEGRPDLAAAELERAVAINPDFGGAWIAWARVEGDRGNAAKRREILERLLAHAEARARQGVAVLDAAQEAEAQGILAEDRRAAGDLAGAAESFARAAALLPDEAAPSIQAGITLRLLGRLDEAAAAHREALRRDPGNPVALVNLANVESDRGDAAAARARLEEAAATCASRRPDLCPLIAERLRGAPAALATHPPSR